jgi:F-type H+-transporting ATPase subunit delta
MKNIIISSSIPLSSAQQQQLKTALNKKFGHQENCSFKVDSDLIGGLKVTFGSLVYDGSIKGKLDKLKQQLTENI